ncbi:hypothetical protein CTEN210_03596 [Chaetoceros tenuissimus]|uniref:RING-type E3 ubiquitin transferase n=1 Tax=Chaetoceros tenuissimus TaxID=426638 RepID=A0AAD3CLK6_9STRA|nr:hypothetical protein CTEN210_03596 [Chaetoceros tenuissimus]
MNAWDRNSETCTSESGCASSADKSSSEDKNQSCVESNAKSIDKEASAEVVVAENKGPWTHEEYLQFLEGLERYGRSWNDVASHVKTRTHEQVRNHGWHYLNKTNCYWTTKEHQRFLEGLEQYGSGRLEEIATLVGTKNKEQVSFHAKKYFEKEEMNKESQKTTDSSEDFSHAALEKSLLEEKKPNSDSSASSTRDASGSQGIQNSENSATSPGHGLSSALLKQKSPESKKNNQRSGNWSDLELEYVTTFIKYYEDGLVDVPDGSTLRQFLSHVLQCTPMRISKKLGKDGGIGNVKRIKKFRIEWGIEPFYGDDQTHGTSGSTIIHEDIEDDSNAAVMSFLQSVAPSYSDQKSKAQPASRTSESKDIEDDSNAAVMSFLQSLAPSYSDQKSKAQPASRTSESKGPWTYSEHYAFLDGLYTYGKDWKQIAALVKSRNVEEVQRHFHSFQQEEPFLSTLRRILDDYTLDNIIAWLPDGQSFRIYNKLTCMTVAFVLYKGDSFNFNHFQRELCTHGFEQNTYNEDWFHPHFCRNPSLGLKEQTWEPIVCSCQTSDWDLHMWVCSNNKSRGEWSTEEHNRFLEGLEKHGRSWKKVASHVETRTHEQVRNYSRTYLNKINSYWTTKEHQLFLEGLEKYGRERLIEIANHVGTKNNKQVLFHAKKYFEQKGMDGKSKKTVERSEKASPVTREEFPDKSSQTKVKTITTLELQKPSEEEIKTKSCEWSAEEHRRFMEGLERFGISWQDIASHVKTRNAKQVREHCWSFLKKTDCYWTTKEHLLFREGLEQYGSGHWEEKASHAEMKSNVQVSFHVMEYFEEMESKGKPQKKADGSEKDFPAARESLDNSNQILFAGDGSNAKRCRDEEDTITRSSKKRTSMESMRQKNTEQSIVTREKDADKEQKQNVIFSMKPFHLKTTKHGATCSDSDITTDVHDTSCPICFEIFNDPHIVPECCHRFCKGCIEEALEYRRECPICRARVTSRRALRRDEVFGNLMRLSEKYKVSNMTASAQLFEKNDRIQHLESRHKEEGKNLENVNQEFQRLEKELKEKHSKIETFENLIRTLFDRNKLKLESIAAEVKDLQAQLQQNDHIIYDLQSQLQQNDHIIYDLQSQLQQRNHKIQHLESRVKADEEKFQFASKATNHLETQLEEENTRSNAFENVARTLSDEHKTRTMAAAITDLQSQLREKDDKIQQLRSKQKLDEEKLEHVTKAIEYLETKVEKKNAEIRILEQVRTHSGVYKIESVTAEVKNLQSQLQEKHDRIQFLESRQKADEDNLRKKNDRIKTLEKLVETLSQDEKKKTVDCPIFIQKTYHMIDSCDPTIASWSDSGDSFVVKDPEIFAKNIIPQYFNHNNFSSFVRQLNFYGFRKCNPIKISKDEEEPESKYWRFRHVFFLRGKQDLLCMIKRVNHSKMAGQEKALKNEVTSLKCQLTAMQGKMKKVTNMMRSLYQNKQQVDGKMTADTLHPALGSFDEKPIAELDLSFGTSLGTIDVVDSTQEACAKEKEETLGQTKDDENIMNENIEAKLQGDANQGSASTHQ